MTRFDTPDHMAHALAQRLSVADAMAHAKTQISGCTAIGDTDGAWFWAGVRTRLAFIKARGMA